MSSLLPDQHGLIDIFLQNQILDVLVGSPALESLIGLHKCAPNLRSAGSLLFGLEQFEKGHIGVIARWYHVAQKCVYIGFDTPAELDSGWSE